MGTKAYCRDINEECHDYEDNVFNLCIILHKPNKLQSLFGLNVPKCSNHHIHKCQMTILNISTFNYAWSQVYEPIHLLGKQEITHL